MNTYKRKVLLRSVERKLNRHHLESLFFYTEDMVMSPMGIDLLTNIHKIWR